MIEDHECVDLVEMIPFCYTHSCFGNARVDDMLINLDYWIWLRVPNPNLTLLLKLLFFSASRRLPMFVSYVCSYSIQSCGLPPIRSCRRPTLVPQLASGVPPKYPPSAVSPNPACLCLPVWSLSGRAWLMDRKKDKGGETSVMVGSGISAACCSWGCCCLHTCQRGRVLGARN